MTRNSGTAAQPIAGPRAWLGLGVMILAYTFSFIDRQALTLMVGPIRKSLQISDTQLSLLHGFAFALFYTVMGVPIGRMVDQKRRTYIIAAGIAVWSVMTAACGLARNFLQMFLARIGVGVGEAALSPGAYSLIGDWFPPAHRTLAMSLYLAAAYIGAGLATMIGGALISSVPALQLPLIGHMEPWQVVFVAIGLPGVLVALTVLTLREPPRTGIKPGIEPHFREVLRHMAAHRSAYVLVILGFAICGMMWNGSIAWWPTFFIRSFGWTASEVGWRYGLVVLLSGSVGSTFGGWLAGVLRKRGHLDANILIGLLTLALALPAGLYATLCGSEWPALSGVFAFLFACSMPFGGAIAALQEITPNQMRGQVAAIYLFSLSFLGMGLGPTMVAAFTDHIFHADAALGQSLALSFVITVPLSAVVLALSRRPYRAALADVDF